MCLVAYIGEGNKSIELQNLYRITKLGVKSKTSETISDSAERYAGLSVRFESSAACM